MTVTATIARDVNLIVTHELELGTITVDPSFESTGWWYDNEGNINDKLKGFTSADTPTFGTFTANVPNPSACNNDLSCGGLTFTGGKSAGKFDNMFGTGSGSCYFKIKYTGTENNFIVSPYGCNISDMSKVTFNEVNSKTITIEYNAS